MPPIFVVHDHVELYLPDVNPSFSSMKIRSKLRASKSRKYHSNVNEEEEGQRKREWGGEEKTHIRVWRRLFSDGITPTDI